MASPDDIDVPANALGSLNLNTPPKLNIQNPLLSAKVNLLIDNLIYCY